MKEEMTYIEISENMWEGWRIAINNAIRQVNLEIVHRDIKNAFDSFYEEKQNNG